MKIVKKVGFMLMLSFLGGVAFAGTDPCSANGVDWGVNYYNPDIQTGGWFDGLPGDASPGWTTVDDNVEERTVADHYLRVSTTVAGTWAAIQTNEAYFTDDATCEMRVRVVSQAGSGNAGQILFSADPSIANSKRSYFAFYTDKIMASTGASYTHDFTQWTIVRLVVENIHDAISRKVTLYLDNDPTPILSGPWSWWDTSTVAGLRFGDVSMSVGGVQWITISFAGRMPGRLRRWNRR